LIAGLRWRAIFLVNVPMGIPDFLRASRLIARGPKTNRASFDNVSTLLLALTLAAYALAMTIGRQNFGALNMALLLAAAFGVGLSVLAKARAASPLIYVPDTVGQEPGWCGDFATPASLRRQLPG